MSGRSTRRGAFTLIELLVVIAILALLMTILLPALAKAREIAKITVDLANVRSVGQGFNFYAQQREGRFPNKASWGNGASSPWHWNPQSGWAPTWNSIVNWEYYKGNDPRYYPSPSNTLNDEPTCGPIIRFWTFWSPTVYKLDYLKTRYSTCPNYKAWISPTGGPYEWGRPYIANQNAIGGRDWDPANPNDPNPPADIAKGIYGKSMARPESIYQYYGGYYLGTRPEAFSTPTSKFLVIESEYGSDSLDAGNGSPTGTVRINANQNQSPDVPPWCGPQTPGGSVAFFAFRHMLPADTTLWQTQARAVVLYVDSHTGTISPNDQISTPARWALGS